jgi:hypothetical protein
MQAAPAPIPPLARRRPDVPVEVLAARTLSLATLGPQRLAAISSEVQRESALRVLPLRPLVAVQAGAGLLAFADDEDEA